MADQLMGDAEIKSNDLIVSMVQQKLIESAVIAPSLMNVSSFAKPGLSSVEFPYSNYFTVKKKTSKVATEAEALTYSSDKIDLNQHAYVKWVIESKAQIQSAVNLEVDALENAALAHAEDFDKYLYDLLYAAGTNVPFTGAGTKIASGDIVDARKIIKASKVRNFAGNVFLAINSAEEASMLKIADFVDASKYGSNVPVLNGEIGQVYGVKVLVTESVDAGKPVMYHKESLYWALQKSPTFMSQDDLENIGKKYLIDQLAGAKIMKSGVLNVHFNA
jgi:N4-gp56 family major capsid protein